MNLTMQQPMTYPFYVSSPRLPFSVPWSPNPFHFPPPTQQHFPTAAQQHFPSPGQQHFPSPAQQHYPSATYQTASSLQPSPHVPYQLPFILSPQPRPNPPAPAPARTLHPSASYTNTRYNHLKQSTSHINRQRFNDPSVYSQRYSMPNYQYRPLKTKSVTDLQQLSDQNSPHLLKAHSWHAINHLQQQPNLNMNYANEIPFNHTNYSHVRQYSPKQKKRSHRRQLSSSPKPTSDPGIVRISTLDEMPVINNPIYRESTSDSNKNLKMKESIRMNSTIESSPSSSNSSHSSLQKRLNGSLRNDPLLSAAIEDFRQLRQTSSQRTSLTSHRRDLSRDSLCSNSTHHSSSSISRSRSQSSFTSLERLEIRRLIKTFKIKDLQPFNNHFQSSPTIPSTIEQFLTKTPSVPISLNKPKKSSITEELDREFRKIRSNNPNEEIIYVKPSLIHKYKTTIPPLPSLDELLYKTHHSSVDLSTFKELDEKTYENPILAIPVPQSSPIVSSKGLINETNIPETKSEYAIPVKPFPEVHLRSNKKEEQIRSFSFCKPMNDIVNENHQTRPLSMLNWIQYGLTNPLPTTFQPNKIHYNPENQNDTSLVKENIYASEMDVHISSSNDKDSFNNQTIVKDYLCEYKQTTHSSSILNDFSRIFARFGSHKHEHKSKLKNKLHKNNHHNVRCSIM